MRDAADAHLKVYIDAAKRLNAGWVEVHTGHHFTSNANLRMTAGLERLKRATAYAKAQGVQLLLGKQLIPGEGVIDFTDMVSRVEAADFSGHYMSAYGSLDDMLSGRDFLVERFPN